MKKEELNSASIGAQLQVSKVGCITGNLIVRRQPESHSIIALNLQTVEDVEQVIRQCEALKGQMQGGLGVDRNTIRNSIVKDGLGCIWE